MTFFAEIARKKNKGTTTVAPLFFFRNDKTNGRFIIF
jgi:hypothetical protein